MKPKNSLENFIYKSKVLKSVSKSNYLEISSKIAILGKWNIKEIRSISIDKEDKSAGNLTKRELKPGND